MTRTKELLNLMKKLGFDESAKKLDNLNERMKAEDIEEY